MLGFLRHSSQQNTTRATEKTRNIWFGRVTRLFQSSELNQDLWNQLEEILVSADIGFTTAGALIERLQERVKGEKIVRSADVLDILKQEMVTILEASMFAEGLTGKCSQIVVLMVGVNGAGKTTSIAKLAQLCLNNGSKVLLGAADTFRAAAIQQLQIWGQQLGVDVVAHQHGADPGAVVYDSLEAARSRGVDVVIIDTAGRLHTQANLMEELKKIRRIISRYDGIEARVVLALDATTGRNGLLQASAFSEATQCDGVFLTKLDGTAKGGVVIAIADELKLPVLYVGTGEGADDIARFDPEEFVNALFAVTETV